MNILIIPDKFKGTLSASAAARAIARGWRKSRPHDSIRLLPMSDGGDGFGEVFRLLFNAKTKSSRTLDAAHRPCVSKWFWEPKTKTAIIESASVIGLAMLPPKKFHPVQLDTFGLGKILHAAAASGAKRCFIGIGGSATNDGGFGVARALGWRFLNGEGHEIKRWIELEDLQSIERPKKPFRIKRIQVAVDVQNPLLGARGATRIYGPQKGLAKKDFHLPERCLARLAKISKKHFSKDLAREPGAGAAGGLGFGLGAFAGAKLVPGFDLFAKLSHLQKHLKWADLVITGEGSIDHSSFMGKGVGQIAHRCSQQNVPCLAIGGVVVANSRLKKCFKQTCALTDFTSSKKAKENPSFWLQQAASALARSFQIAI